MWSGVGILLNFFASRWIVNFTARETVFSIISGIVLGILIAHFGFIGIANKNIQHISKYPEHVCIFAFQEWKSYFLIIFMMSMGIFMRTSGFFPEILLAPVYIGIGSALFISALLYFRIYRARDRTF